MLIEQAVLYVKMSSFSKTFLIIDIFRAAIIFPTIVGIMLEVSCLRVDRLIENEGDIPPPDYEIERGKRFDARALVIKSLIAGMVFCGIDVLLALTLHKSLVEQIRIAYTLWFILTIPALGARSYFYYYLWENEKYLGWDILQNLTQVSKVLMKSMFLFSVGYESVKVVELLVGLKGLIGGVVRQK